MDLGPGSGVEPPFSNKDAGFRLTNGADPFTCSWEGEWDVQPWQDIVVGYFTPEGHWVANAFRDERWMAMWTFDPEPGFLEPGLHSYHFDWAYTVPAEASMSMDPREVQVSSSLEGGGETPIYGGYALIGPWYSLPQQAWTGSACEVVSPVHPEQPMRFVWGWVNDYSMTYEEALAHFGSFTVQASWDGASPGSANLVMGELLPFTGREARWEHLCTLTEHP